jgi:hypothetical protein
MAAAERTKDIHARLDRLIRAGRRRREQDDSGSIN